MPPWPAARRRHDVRGQHFSLTEARNEPRPVQAKLPIWIGGGGEKRTLNIAAKYADGWNVPFVAPEVFAPKSAVLDRHCAEVGRDPADIKLRHQRRAGVHRGEPAGQFGAIADFVRPGVLSGSDEVVEPSGGTSRPVPTRSTWRCARRSTSTRSNASVPCCI